MPTGLCYRHYCHSYHNTVPLALNWVAELAGSYEEPGGGVAV
ncbi:MAG: hypothetical protein ACK5HT_09855 [Draconibacterium sp.]